MTLTDATPGPDAAATPESAARRATSRTVLMCRPDHFTVSYRINPWMHPQEPTDTGRAVRQWETLYETYLALGITVELIDPVEGLPDMVYAANGGFVLDGVAYGALFAYEERAAEGPAYMRWFEKAGYSVRGPHSVNEGEGDFLLAGDVILAGYGFRSDRASHAELADIFGREVVGLELVDPRFYHLDTALAVLDPEPANGMVPTIAYLPAAFSESSRAELERRFPDAILVADSDAVVLGLNCYSDGQTVVIAAKATGFERQLTERGYTPVGVELDELLRGGGGVKCCTLELRR